MPPHLERPLRHGDRLEIRLFGGFSVHLGNEVLPPMPSRVARLLFAHLVLHAGAPQARTLLTDQFWPDVAESRARRRLSHVLWQLQDALAELHPGIQVIHTRGDAVVFDAPGAYWLDVEEFEQRLDRVDMDQRLDAEAERQLRRCVELYRGDLLAGYYDGWVVETQQQLEHRYLTALWHLVEACRQQGNFRDALTFARRATHQAPLREDIHREVMRLCVLLGQPSQALEQYERCRSVLSEELGAEPAAETEQLHQQVLAARTVASPTRDRPQHLISRRMVGRDEERTELVDQLERALAGRGNTVLVEGEPGVGKSQLLTQLADDARWRGFSVLWGGCPETAGRGPYTPIREALEPELQPIRVAQLRHALAPVWLDDCARLLPALGTSARADDTLDEADRADRMRESLVRLTLELSALTPTLLVIEDAQWADDETLPVLHELATRSHDGQLLVVLTFRGQEARDDDAVWAGLRALDRDARPHRLRLGPLSVFETRELVVDVLGVADVPSAFVSNIQRESGGNPLYVLELLRALRDEGELTPEVVGRLDDITVPVATSVRAIIADRLGRLDDLPRRVVDLAAVLGTEFDLDTLSAAMELDGAELMGAVGQLLQLNLLEQTPLVCRFAHAITRRVVLGELSPLRTRALHLRAGMALETTGSELIEQMAEHFQAGGQPRRALEYLRRAITRALGLHAYATAARHMDHARLALSQTLVPVEERHELLCLHEHILDVLGRRDEQAQVLAELEPLTGGDPGREFDRLLRVAMHRGHTGEFAEARAHAQQAGGLASTEADRRRAHTVLGEVLTWAGDIIGAVEVLSVVPHDDRAPASAETAFALGTALRFLQDYPRAEDELRRALELADHHDDEPGRVRALGALADLHTESGDPGRALDEYAEAIDRARRIGYRHREGVSLVNSANLLQLRGDPQGAAHAYDEAEGLFQSLGSSRGVALVRANRAWLRHRWLGDDDGAHRDAELARAWLASVGHRGVEAVCLESLGAVARERGLHDDAADLLDRALGHAQGAGEHRAEAQVRRGLAELALAKGEPQTAVEHLRAARDLSSRFALADLDPDLSSLAGMAWSEVGDPVAAWGCAEEALAMVDGSTDPHRVHHRVARLAARTGRADLATRHARRAHELLVAAVERLSDRDQERALAVPEHAAIVADAESLLPRTVVVEMAVTDAVRGRALHHDEVVDVELSLGPPPTDAGQRRQQVLSVLHQARDQGAVATVAGLAELFGVSRSTVHRDLERLRQAGEDAETRGTGVG